MGSGETGDTTSVLQAMEQDGANEEDIYDGKNREYERKEFQQYIDQKEDSKDEREKNQTPAEEEKNQEQEKKSSRRNRIPKKTKEPKQRKMPARKERREEPPTPIERKVSGKEINNNNNEEKERKTNDNNNRDRNNNNDNNNKKNSKNNNNNKTNNYQFFTRIGIVSENSNEISRYRNTIKNIIGIGIKYIEKIIESGQGNEDEKRYMTDINEIKDKMGERFSDVVN